MKQLGLWSSLGSHGWYVFSLAASVFTLVVKQGTIKFWHSKLNLTLKVKVNHHLSKQNKTTPPTPPLQKKPKKQTNRDLNQGILHL